MWAKVLPRSGGCCAGLSQTPTATGPGLLLWRGKPPLVTHQLKCPPVISPIDPMLVQRKQKNKNKHKKNFSPSIKILFCLAIMGRKACGVVKGVSR